MKLDKSWAAHGRELVNHLRANVEAHDGSSRELPTAYLCGADVPGLVAYVDSLVAAVAKKSPETRRDLYADLLELARVHGPRSEAVREQVKANAGVEGYEEMALLLLLAFENRDKSQDRPA